MSKEIIQQVKEIRAIPFELAAEKREADEPKVLEGYAALFGIEADIWWFTEEIVPGAFAEAIGRDDVRALLNHDANYVLGRNKAGTLELREDDKGLWVKIILPNNTLGNDVYESVKRGDISQMSFSFYVTREEWISGEEGEKDHRKVLEVTLVDVAPVTFPAYEETEINARSVFDARKIIDTDGQVAIEETVDDDEMARVRMAHRKRKLNLLSNGE